MFRKWLIVIFVISELVIILGDYLLDWSISLSIVYSFIYNLKRMHANYFHAKLPDGFYRFNLRS